MSDAAILHEIQRTLGRLEGHAKATRGDLRGLKAESVGLEKRVRSLESWRWYALGGVGALLMAASLALRFL